MVKEDLRISLAELNIILNAVVPEEGKNKIAKSFIEYMENNKVDHVDFEYDYSKEINEQKVHKDTYILLGILYLKYWATPEEKKEVLTKLDENERKFQEKVSSDNIFKNDKVENKIEEEIKKEELPTIYKESFIEKIISSIKKIFKKG